MRVIRASEHVALPWKNGGGTATLIVGEPEAGGFESFDWRLSGACVAKEGPFSLFPNTDRLMLLLRGGRLILDGAASKPVTLTTSSAPFVFPGDAPVVATVPDGPIDNLNLMFDRRRFASAASRLPPGAAREIHPRGVAIVFCEDGSLAIEDPSGRASLAKADAVTTRSRFTLSGEGHAILLAVWPI